MTEQERLDKHNKVMLTCINASIEARDKHPNDPKAVAFMNATLDWYFLPNKGEK